MTKIWIVDAFTSTPYRGNPAAVMVLAACPKDEVCQAIAAEMNLSETAFVVKLPGNRFHIRWFTPKAEVKLCGHATLASAHILFQEGIATGDKVAFDSLSGELRVTREEGGLVLDFPLQETGSSLASAPFESALAGAGKILEVVKAFDDIIVEIESAEKLKSLQADAAKIAALECRGLIVTAKGAGPYDFISRFFAPRIGVAEDPVTGSAHCKLASYWQKKLGKQEFVAYQASERGGELHLRVRGDRVLLKGQTVTILEGEWKPKLP